jgi:CRISPR-associated exonuclease Cas4
MLRLPVPEGDVFHAASRRRRHVALDAALRSETEAVVAAVRAMLIGGSLPEPVNDARCSDCSLRRHCLPEVGVHAGPDSLFVPVDLEASADA